MINIYIVDDHRLIREGFRKIIEKEHDISIVGEAGNARDFFKDFVLKNCDLVVLDLNLPDKNGLDVLKEIKAVKPDLPVLILSMHPEERYAIRTFKAGASGYISKEFADEKLIKAIREIMSGGKYVSKEFGQIMAGDLLHNRGGLHDNLSDRELQIFLMIGYGKPVRDIAGKLSLSINIINTYRKRILEKMNLKSNVEIIRYVIQNNLGE